MHSRQNDCNSGVDPGPEGWPYLLYFLPTADLALADQLPANDRIVLSMTDRPNGRPRPHWPIIEMTFAFSFAAAAFST